MRYRVQIAAAKREVGKTYFEQRHNMMDEITIDYHGTWFKYMIGSYGVYKDARDRRNEVWADNNKIDDAFVTAYNSGERISVQEAESEILKWVVAINKAGKAVDFQINSNIKTATELVEELDTGLNKIKEIKVTANIDIARAQLQEQLVDVSDRIRRFLSVE